MSLGGVSLVALAICSAASVAVVAVGWANARTQPKADDRPYLVSRARPLAYLIAAFVLPAGALAVAGVLSAHSSKVPICRPWAVYTPTGRFACIRLTLDRLERGNDL